MTRCSAGGTGVPAERLNDGEQLPALLEAIRVQTLLVGDVVNRLRLAGTAADRIALNRVRRAVADLVALQDVIQKLAFELQESEA